PSSSLSLSSIILSPFFFSRHVDHRDLHSFPTRRSSDLIILAKGIASGMPISAVIAKEDVMQWNDGGHGSTFGGNPVSCASEGRTDRKSTRLNSSHGSISYAVFCLKKKKKTKEQKVHAAR